MQANRESSNYTDFLTIAERMTIASEGVAPETYDDLLTGAVRDDVWLGILEMWCSVNYPKWCGAASFQAAIQQCTEENLAIELERWNQEGSLVQQHYNIATAELEADPKDGEGFTLLDVVALMNSYTEEQYTNIYQEFRTAIGYGPFGDGIKYTASPDGSRWYNQDSSKFRAFSEKSGKWEELDAYNSNDTWITSGEEESLSDVSPIDLDPVYDFYISANGQKLGPASYNLDGAFQFLRDCSPAFDVEQFLLGSVEAGGSLSRFASENTVEIYLSIDEKFEATARKSADRAKGKAEAKVFTFNKMFDYAPDEMPLSFDFFMLHRLGMILKLTELNWTRRVKSHRPAQTNSSGANPASKSRIGGRRIRVVIDKYVLVGEALREGDRQKVQVSPEELREISPKLVSRIQRLKQEIAKLAEESHPFKGMSYDVGNLSNESEDFKVQIDAKAAIEGEKSIHADIKIQVRLPVGSAWFARNAPIIKALGGGKSLPLVSFPNGEFAIKGVVPDEIWRMWVAIAGGQEGKITKRKGLLTSVEVSPSNQEWKNGLKRNISILIGSDIGLGYRGGVKMR